MSAMHVSAIAADGPVTVAVSRIDALRVRVEWPGEVVFDAAHPFPTRSIERAASELLGVVVVLDETEECSWAQGPQWATWRMATAADGGKETTMEIESLRAAMFAAWGAVAGVRDAAERAEDGDDGAEVLEAARAAALRGYREAMRAEDEDVEAMRIARTEAFVAATGGV